MAAAERIAEYLKQCGVFYLATLDGIWPRLRPMNNVCVCGGVIHFLFNKDDEIYGQLLLNDRAEICATHPDQSTICISCKLREDKGEEPRRAMLRSCEGNPWTGSGKTAGIPCSGWHRETRSSRILPERRKKLNYKRKRACDGRVFHFLKGRRGSAIMESKYERM